MNRHAPDLAQKGSTRKHHDERRSHYHRQRRHDCETGRHGCAGEGILKETASRKTGAPKGQRAAKGSKTKPVPKKDVKAGKKATKPTRAKEASAPRAESKGAKILELIGRPKGASLAEIMKATDWQAHSVRGFLSTAAKKQGLKIESTKNEAGERIYNVKK